MALKKIQGMRILGQSMAILNESPNDAVTTIFWRYVALKVIETKRAGGAGHSAGKVSFYFHRFSFFSSSGADSFIRSGCK